MKNILCLALLALAVTAQPWMQIKLTPVERANILLAEMTLTEKCDMMHGWNPANYSMQKLKIPKNSLN